MDKGQNLLEKVIEKAKQTPQKVAFPEAEDPKMLKAIDRAVRAGICELYIVGDSQKIKQNCLENQIDDQNGTISTSATKPTKNPSSKNTSSCQTSSSTNNRFATA